MAKLTYEKALRYILEIAYSGHPEGREVRLIMIGRYAKEALETELQCTSPCVDNYCPVHGIAAKGGK